MFRVERHRLRLFRKTPGNLTAAHKNAGHLSLAMGRDYRKLRIWQWSYDLTLDCYKLLEKLPASEEKNIADQLRRAMTSLPLNIAEGCAAKSYRTFLNHLDYAYQSGKEVEVLLLLCKDVAYISAEEYVLYNDKLQRLLAKLYKFMLFIENEIKKNAATAPSAYVKLYDRWLPRTMKKG